MADCRCGCGTPVPDGRVFVDKNHQLAWMTAGGARELNALTPDEARRRGGAVSGRAAVESGRLAAAGRKGAKRSREIARDLRESGLIHPVHVTERSERRGALVLKLFEQLAVMEKIKAKVGTRRPALCANCQIGTEQELVESQQVWPTAGPFSPSTGEGLAWLQVWSCLYCDKTTALVGVWDLGTEGLVLKEGRQVWPTPQPRELPEEAPPVVRSLYREASVALNAGVLRAAAALYRAAVEQIVTERGARNVDGLAESGLDAEVMRDLHDARLTGNWSLHEGTEFSAEEITDLALLIEDAVELLWVEPERRRRFRERRAARRRHTSE